LENQFRSSINEKDWNPTQFSRLLNKQPMFTLLIKRVTH
jgi:hypothetical protein